MDVNNVFEAYPKSIEHLLGEKGAGFYVPVYQREYSWPPSMVATLLSDCLLGLQHLVDNEDSITFIGSTIVIKDNRHETIHPMSIGDLPQGVFLVIDGQQRLTTIILACTVFHNLLSEANLFLEKKKNKEAYNWLLTQILRLNSDLECTFLIDQSYPKDEPSLRYYPKMIRAQQDHWSREKKVAEYNSPIGNYLYQYIGHHFSEEDPKPSFMYSPPNDEKKHKTITDILKLINKEVKSIIEKGNDDFDFPKLSHLSESKPIKDIIFNGVIPPDVINILLKDEPTKDEQKFRKIFRLVTFGSFVLRRIAITEVIVKNEDYAFDMFEALNTTGEPLTAFETFKPEIIRVETLKNWEGSPSYNYVQTIELLLNQYKKAEDKQKATSDLLIPFRLSESGLKLTKKLNDQRKYLRKEYQRQSSIDKKREFVQALSFGAAFENYVWPKSIQTKSRLKKDIEITNDTHLLCLSLLRKSNHDMTKGLLFRYYGTYINAEDDDTRKEALELFKNATKAITAFYVLWRSSRATTDGIDSHYRTIMSSGFLDKTAGIDIKPLGRQKNEGKVLDLNELQNALKYILATKSKNVKIISKADWLKHSIQAPIYTISANISKFILLSAYHNSKSKDGILEKGRKSLAPFLTNQAFLITDLTLEHIAPQSPDRNLDNWDWQIYDEDVNTKNSLGNLTLLPQSENSAIGNNSWNHKKYFYKALSSETDEDLNKIITKAKKDKILFPDSTLKILQDSDYLPFVSSVAEIEEFNLKKINERSQNIANLAWDELSTWLNY